MESIANPSCLYKCYFLSSSLKFELSEGDVCILFSKMNTATNKIKTHNWFDCFLVLLSQSFAEKIKPYNKEVLSPSILIRIFVLLFAEYVQRMFLIAHFWRINKTYAHLIQFFYWQIELSVEVSTFNCTDVNCFVPSMIFWIETLSRLWDGLFYPSVHKSIVNYYNESGLSNNPK